MAALSLPPPPPSGTPEFDRWVVALYNLIKFGVGSSVFTTLLDISASTAGQIKFPATENSASDVHTLDDYEEGTWTPTDASGASLTLTGVAGDYTKIGRMVFTRFSVTYPTTSDTSSAAIGGLPFTVSAASTGTIFSQDTVGATVCKALATSTSAGIFGLKGVAITNANLSTKIVQGGFMYMTST